MPISINDLIENFSSTTPTIRGAQNQVTGWLYAEVGGTASNGWNITDSFRDLNSAVVSGTSIYIFNGSSTSDAEWQNATKWVEVSGASGGIDLTDLSVDTQTPASTTTSSLTYDNTTGQFDFTPVDITGKQDTLSGTGDVPGLTAALNAKQDTLTGTGDVPGLTTALGNKADKQTITQSGGTITGTINTTAGTFSLTAPTGGGGDALTSAGLDQFNSVVFTGLANGDYFFFNGSNWENITKATLESQLGYSKPGDNVSGFVNDANYTVVGHTHTKSDITDFSDADYAPAAHTHTLSQVTDSGTAAALDVAASGNAAVGEVVKGNDTRLTNARTPTAHTHVKSDITDFSDADYAPAAHTHVLNDVTDAGTSAALDVPSSGNATAGQVVKGDDTRLTDSRTPEAHTHPISDITSLQTSLDAKLESGDNVSELTNDANYITSAGAPVQSVNAATGAVVLDNTDVGAAPDGSWTQSGGTITGSIDATNGSFSLTAPTGGGGDALTTAGLDQFDSVTFTSLADVDIMMYDNATSDWINVPPAGHKAVWYGTGSTGEVITWDGTTWNAGTLAYSDLSGLPVLGTVATTNAYGDLSGLPVFGTVATTNNYSDLGQLPTFVAGTNVTIQTATNGAGGTQYTIASSGTGTGATSLAGLSDVLIPSPANGEVLTYNGATSEWNSGPISYPVTGVTNLGTASGGGSLALIGSVINYVEPDLTSYAETANLGNSAGLDVGTTAGTVAAGDDARLSDARTPTPHTHTHVDITDFDGEVNTLASSRIAASNIGNLGNVSSTAPSTGQVLKWDGSEWAPGTDNTGVSTGPVTLAYTGHLEAPVEKTYYLSPYTPAAQTATGLYAICDTGTCTVEFKSNGVSLGSINVTASTNTQATPSSTTIPASEDVIMIVTSVSACFNLRFALEYTQ